MFIKRKSASLNYSVESDTKGLTVQCANKHVIEKTVMKTNFLWMINDNKLEKIFNIILKR